MASTPNKFSALELRLRIVRVWSREETDIHPAAMAVRNGDFKALSYALSRKTCSVHDIFILKDVEHDLLSPCMNPTAHELSQTISEPMSLQIGCMLQTPGHASIAKLLIKAGMHVSSFHLQLGGWVMERLDKEDSPSKRMYASMWENIVRKIPDRVPVDPSDFRKSILLIIVRVHQDNEGHYSTSRGISEQSEFVEIVQVFQQYYGVGARQGKVLKDLSDKEWRQQRLVTVGSTFTEPTLFNQAELDRKFGCDFVKIS